MYSIEIKDENFNTFSVLHFLDLPDAFNFVKNFDCLHWAWNDKWKHIYVYHITNECDGEHMMKEFIQFSISREAFEKLKY